MILLHHAIKPKSNVVRDFVSSAALQIYPGTYHSTCLGALAHRRIIQKHRHRVCTCRCWRLIEFVAGLNEARQKIAQFTTDALQQVRVLKSTAVLSASMLASVGICPPPEQEVSRGEVRRLRRETPLHWEALDGCGTGREATSRSGFS